MGMYQPPHPGEFIQEIYLAPHAISVRTIADKLGVAASTLQRLVNGQTRVSPGMALRLSKTLGRSPESWLAMQGSYDLWIAQQTLDLRGVRQLDIESA